MLSLENGEEQIEHQNYEIELKIYPSTCRICLKTAKDLTHLFTPSKDSLPPSEKINYCVDIQIFENDGLPQNICENCNVELDTSLLFKKKCLESNEKLCRIKCDTVQCIKQEYENPVIKNEDETSIHSFQSCDDNESLNKYVKKKILKKNSKSKEKETLNFLKSKKRNVHLPLTLGNSKSSVEVSELEDSFESLSGTHQCKSCGKLVSTKAAMINHYKSHSGPTNCPACNKRFSTKTLCTRHYKNVHLAYTETCGVCGRSFKLPATLQTHLKTHSACKPHSCTHCGRGFLSKHNMLMHTRSHLQVRDFCCHLCGMNFVTPGALRFHSIRKHAKVRPFPCKFNGCSLSFAAQSELARHETTHTATRKYVCAHCHKGFKRTDVYGKHMRKEHGLDGKIDTKQM